MERGLKNFEIENVETQKFVENMDSTYRNEILKCRNKINYLQNENSLLTQKFSNQCNLYNKLKKEFNLLRKTINSLTCNINNKSIECERIRDTSRNLQNELNEVLATHHRLIKGNIKDALVEIEKERISAHRSKKVNELARALRDETVKC